MFASIAGAMASLGSSDPAAAGTDPLQYDLTTTIAGSLDRHLVFPLLEFLSSKQLYPAEDIEQAKLELIEKTNMVDYAVDIYQSLHQTDEVRGGCGDSAHDARTVPRCPACLVEHMSAAAERKGGIGGVGKCTACSQARHPACLSCRQRPWGPPPCEPNAPTTGKSHAPLSLLLFASGAR